MFEKNWPVFICQMYLFKSYAKLLKNINYQIKISIKNRKFRLKFRLMRLNFTLERKRSRRASNIKECIRKGINIINCICEN